MSKNLKIADSRVDAFVAAVNASRTMGMSCESVPEPCRLSNTSSDDTCDWQIVPSRGSTWIPALEAKLPHHLPPTFRSLASRYLFPSFDCGPITFYSVGVTDPVGEFNELRIAVLRDNFLLKVLHKHGYMPFSRPADGSYDPVCFDYHQNPNCTEPAVVRIDHEDILCRGRIRVMQAISPGFHLLLEEMTSRLSAQSTS